MVIQSKPIPINQARREFPRRTNRFSEQRIQSQRVPENPKPYNPSPPQESPPQIPGFPGGDFKGWSLFPPIQSPNASFIRGSAFPAGPLPPDNFNGFGHQRQYIETRDETPSPPVGYSAASIHGFSGPPPYPMPEFSPPLNAQSPDASFNSTSPQYEQSGEPQAMYQQEGYPNQFQPRWPQNQHSLPYLAFFPNPTATSFVPCGANGCNCSPPPPQPQWEHSFPLNSPSLRMPLPMPMPYFVDPYCLGMIPEAVEPPRAPFLESNGYVNGNHPVRKGRTFYGRKTNVRDNSQVMKMSSEENWKLGNRQRLSSTSAISFPFCTFCKSNRETRQYYQSHVLKNETGVITCPVLRKYMCPICKAVGDNAHTIKYCPENKEAASMSFRSQKSALKKKRNSRGIIGAYRYG